jgi:CRP-like cAMP-binding protein
MTKQSSNINLEPTPISKESIFDNPMIKYISQFTKLTEKEAIDFMACTDVKSFKKGHFLLKEGEFKDICGFVLKGCLRQYCIVDGVELTTNFYTEGQPVQAHEGATKNEPSTYFLVCNEDCTLTVGSLISDDEFLNRFPKIANASSASYEMLLAKQHNNLANFIIKSPEQRYLHLLETRPELIDRVPQYQLASYLGIKPESLSRIRKRIMLGK